MRLRRIRNRLNPVWILTFGLAVALVAMAYLQFSRPVPEVLIAKQDISEGAAIQLDDFELVGLDLGVAKNAYVTLDQFPSGGVLAKSITAGEVLAKSQITEFAPKGLTVIRFRPELPIAESLKIGDRVSVWVVQGEQFEQLDPAEQISQGRLLAIEASEGLFADEQPFVEINIPEVTLPEVLKSMAANDKVFLVEPGK